MSGNSQFEPAVHEGWQAGFRNLFRAEMRSWWRTRTWWVQILIWVGAVDGLLLTILSAGVDEEMLELTLLYGVFGGFFVAVGVIIIMQGAVVGEKIDGTAAWVLSKPVSRAAFLLSKWLGSTIGIGVTAILVPGLIAYALFAFYAGLPISALNFLKGMGVLLLFNLFWLSLTLMLGVYFNNRGAVIGIPLALVLGQQFFTGMLAQLSPKMIEILPFGLVMPDLIVPGKSISGMLITGETLPTTLPVYTTLLWIVFFLAVGTWRFNQEEL